ncbi:putative dehydrogenase [Clostridium saccharoperbutylacetonicum]|nr:putative dehydrogenase [Clostridium saccharoperbutylacetonicum]
MKLGIIGAGMIVREFLTITPNLKNFELTAILGRKNNETAINELKNEYGIKNIFYDYDELLNSEVDTIYVALPNNLHFEFAKRALEANKNVIIEKPMTSTYKQAVILSELAKKRNLFIFEAITNQYFPNYKRLKN